MKKEMIDYLLLLGVVGLFMVYFITSIPRATMYELTCPLDLCIPFISVFVIPYCSFQAFLIPFTIFWLYQASSKKLLRIFLISAVLLLSLSNFIFFIFPTHFPHRAEIIDDSLFSQLVRLVYTVDYPCALCPSVHVNISVLCALVWSEIDSKLSNYMIFWACMVALSTLFIRQHYVVDVVAGVVTAILCYLLGKKITYEYFYSGDMRWKKEI